MMDIRKCRVKRYAVDVLKRSTHAETHTVALKEKPLSMSKKKETHCNDSDDVVIVACDELPLFGILF